MDELVFEQAIISKTDDSVLDVVVGLTLNIYDTKINANEYKINLSFVAYKMIDNATMENKKVYVNKSIIGNELQPWELTVAEELSVENIMDASIAKIRTLLSPVISKVSGLSLYGFMVLNNELVAKGFAIYAENREETYLKILETGDEQLINKLEDYLNYKDQIERVSQLERQFTNVIEEIKNQDTIEAVLEIENKFLEKVLPQLA